MIYNEHSWQMVTLWARSLLYLIKDWTREVWYCCPPCDFFSSQYWLLKKSQGGQQYHIRSVIVSLLLNIVYDFCFVVWTGGEEGAVNLMFGVLVESFVSGERSSSSSSFSPSPTKVSSKDWDSSEACRMAFLIRMNRIKKIELPYFYIPLFLILSSMCAKVPILSIGSNDVQQVQSSFCRI